MAKKHQKTFTHILMIARKHFERCKKIRKNECFDRYFVKKMQINEFFYSKTLPKWLTSEISCGIMYTFIHLYVFLTFLAKSPILLHRGGGRWKMWEKFIDFETNFNHNMEETL